MMGRFLSIVFVLAIFLTLDEQGIFGAVITMALCHIAYRAKHGHWWEI